MLSIERRMREKKILMKKKCECCGVKIIVRRIDWEGRKGFLCDKCKGYDWNKNAKEKR